MKKRILSVITLAAMAVTSAQGIVFPVAQAAQETKAAEITGTVVKLDPSNASPFNNG